LVSGGSAFYVLIYAVFYFVNKVLLSLFKWHFSGGDSWIWATKWWDHPVCPYASTRQLTCQLH